MPSSAAPPPVTVSAPKQVRQHPPLAAPVDAVGDEAREHQLQAAGPDQRRRHQVGDRHEELTDLGRRHRPDAEETDAHDAEDRQDPRARADHARVGVRPDEPPEALPVEQPTKLEADAGHVLLEDGFGRCRGTPPACGRARKARERASSAACRAAAQASGSRSNSTTARAVSCGEAIAVTTPAAPGRSSVAALALDELAAAADVGRDDGHAGRERFQHEQRQRLADRRQHRDAELGQDLLRLADSRGSARRRPGPARPPAPGIPAA